MFARGASAQNKCLKLEAMHDTYDLRIIETGRFSLPATEVNLAEAKLYALVFKIKRTKGRKQLFTLLIRHANHKIKLKACYYDAKMKAENFFGQGKKNKVIVFIIEF